MDSDKKWWSIIKLLLKLAVTVFSLWWVSRKVDVNEVMMAFKTTNLWYVLLAALFFILSKIISSIRLNVFFHAIGLYFSQLINLRLYWLGMFYNLFLPGGIGGDGYKIWWLNKQYQTSAKKLFWAVFLDRVSGLVALALLILALLLVVPLPDKLNTGLAGISLRQIIIIGAFVACIAFYLFYYLWFKEFLSSFFKTGLQALFVQLAQMVSVFFILRALGIKGHLLEYELIFLISSAIAVLPFTIGGLGARELVFLFGSSYLLLDMHFAVTISLWFYLITAAVSFIGVYYVFNQERLTVSEQHKGL
ncbi:lysylphosphatidylglycerol synthase transmembrane domain-containing protein [Solitalea lacus]|uniref:lysylphosphatidylglycerol synthase transmembrane domain-containing protein n=1 Tax=Solitalea lacus TaxID=2911172 RepID=UPI001EDC8586|nr:lysylphosphatidylglycerol synthase transmembrane domain-containing protein [Solitalea lacus]UKJ07632.1 flippase-like domain-containing protein [Solitalea lacus]